MDGGGDIGVGRNGAGGGDAGAAGRTGAGALGGTEARGEGAGVDESAAGLPPSFAPQPSQNCAFGGA
ncbi:hypothetical protein CVU37_07225 [candidate division BRC1 bacterium HGW-BRC1-1]|nr:MAG: hypothetical protein CVU37_07225 [candidate division BRC1 bacterium HGW-BRC1-1]